MGNDEQRKDSRRRMSLCEKSMQMVVSVAKSSTLSLARMSLGSPASASPAIAKVSVATQPVMFPSSSSSSSSSSRNRSQVPDSTRVTYLVEPVGSENSQLLRKDSKCVDGMATEYIRRVHERNRLDPHEAAKMLQDILPPPPAPSALIGAQIHNYRHI